MTTLNDTLSMPAVRRTVRRWCQSVVWWWQDLELRQWFRYKVYIPLRDQVSPRQRWLTREIPKQYTDLSYLMPHLTYRMLQQFVEGENGLEVLQDQVTADYGPMDAEVVAERRTYFQAAYVELEAAYQWSLKRAREAESMQEDLNSKLLEHARDKDRLQALEIFERREEQYQETDLRHLQNIMRHHKVLWT